MWLVFIFKDRFYSHFGSICHFCTAFAPWIKLVDAVNESNKVFYVFSYIFVSMSHCYTLSLLFSASETQTEILVLHISL